MNKLTTSGVLGSWLRRIALAWWGLMWKSRFHARVAQLDGAGGASVVEAA